MDIYKRFFTWKRYLALAAIALLVASLLYTNGVADKLATAERQRAELWAKAIVEISKPYADPDCININPNCLESNTEFIFSIVESNQTIPVIFTDRQGNIQDFVNLDTLRARTDTSYLRKQLNIMKQQREPIVFSNGYDEFMVYYKNSRLLTLLIYFPYFQIALIVVFLLIGYWAFSTAQQAEQNQVWVGLAKETAHQLGTPITAIVGWIENLKLIVEEDVALGMLDEFRNDVRRLELIAERFSKIGAVPELETANVIELIAQNMEYMQKRASRRIVFEYPKPEITPPLIAQINPNLFDWVLENLLKNGLDAMDGKGKITATAFEDEDFVYIDIEDTGKGIPPSKLKTIFKPGYSTKKRGWGLGLSLTQRIIKNYHKGKVFVKFSELGKGTVFRIQLPKK